MTFSVSWEAHNKRSKCPSACTDALSLFLHSLMAASITFCCFSVVASLCFLRHYNIPHFFNYAVFYWQRIAICHWGMHRLIPIDPPQRKGCGQDTASDHRRLSTRTSWRRSRHHSTTMRSATLLEAVSSDVPTGCGALRHRTRCAALYCVPVWTRLSFVPRCGENDAK